MRIFRTLATAVALPVLLIACSSDSSTPGTTTGTTTGATTGTTTGATTGNTTGSTTRSFFNADAGISFANTMGGGFSNAFAAIAGGLGGGDTTAGRSDLGTTLKQRVTRATQSDSVACDGGGSLTVTSTTNDATGEPTAFGLTFNNCVSEGVVSTGSVSFSVAGAEPNQTITMNFNNFGSVENGITNSINGSVSIAVVESGAATSVTISGSSITMVSDGETITYSNYSLASGQDSAGNASISGSATITTSEGTVMMVIDPPLVTGASDFPETGALLLTHSDGSSLLIDADSGDPATFNFVINDGGTITTGVESWANTDVDEIAL